ncbi:hypothetical protein RHS01_01759 [Rhizoctonia solani]|uniref:Uncharacterized protein n=1 Tax=Rhizoctonia solani TaxID=456999 RepID=A0A8H7IMV9_9AGAM|nr:hypothetical protein RHS01_01759 [Rhizoctonia solani]
MFRSRGLDDDYHFNFWPRCHHLYDALTRRTAAGGVVARLAVCDRVESCQEETAQAAAAGHGSRDTGYESRPKASRESTGRGSITSATSGRGDSGGGKASPERTRRDPSPQGWGSTGSGGGWGASHSGGWGATTTNDSGWGAPSADTSFGNASTSGWGEPSDSVWGNPEPSSRRNSSFGAPKSPTKPDKSPPRHSHSSSSKDKDRERERERERHRERDRAADRDYSRRRSPSPSKPSSKLSSRDESNRSPKPTLNTSFRQII